jgi:hypothetical protein
MVCVRARGGRGGGCADSPVWDLGGCRSRTGCGYEHGCVSGTVRTLCGTALSLPREAAAGVGAARALTRAGSVQSVQSRAWCGAVRLCAQWMACAAWERAWARAERRTCRAGARDTGTAAVRRRGCGRAQSHGGASVGRSIGIGSDRLGRTCIGSNLIPPKRVAHHLNVGVGEAREQERCGQSCGAGALGCGAARPMRNGAALQVAERGPESGYVTSNEGWGTPRSSRPRGGGGPRGS